MPFIFLLLFALICLQTSWPGPPSWLTPAGCAILVGAIVLMSWLSAGLIARVLAWQLDRFPESRGMLLRRYARCRRNHFIGLLAAYLLSLYWLGWGQVLETAWRDGLWQLFGFDGGGLLPGFQIGLLTPFFAGLFLSWERFYRVEKTAYEWGHSDDRFISRPAYLLMQVRHQMFLVVPPMVLLFVQQLLFSFGTGGGEEDNPVLAGIAVALMAVMFVAMPLLLRIFLGLKPLPPGPLRDRLERTAALIRFRYSNILIWNTRNLFANALVTGFIPWVRYIVLTDRLVEELTPDEIEAVFGHEIGHIKHHHLMFYLSFFLASFILLGLAWDFTKDWFNQDQIAPLLQALPEVGADVRETLYSLSSFAKLGLLAAYTLIVFGFLSRRCERQADLFGSRVASTDIFISALEKVAAINGIPRNRFSWQHPSIAQRIDFLERMRDNPALLRRFHRSIQMMQWASLCLLMFLFWYFQLPGVWKLLAEF